MSALGRHDADGALVVKLCRIPRRVVTRMVARALGEGLFEVDATWGVVQPIELAPGVRTIGELELIDHIKGGLPLIDTRLRSFFGEPTIPTARRIPHGEMRARMAELDPDVPTAFFCNGPQCAATPDAISTLLDAGRLPELILYYRGGLHDWMTLGYPVVEGAPAQER